MYLLQTFSKYTEQTADMLWFKLVFWKARNYVTPNVIGVCTRARARVVYSSLYSLSVEFFLQVFCLVSGSGELLPYCHLLLNLWWQKLNHADRKTAWKLSQFSRL